MVILRDLNKIDNRHTVDIINSYSHAIAIQINDDGTKVNKLHCIIL